MTPSRFVALVRYRRMDSLVDVILREVRPRMRKLDIEAFDPARLLKPGNADPLVLQILWCVRKAFYPMLWVGLLMVLRSGRKLVDVSELDTMPEIVEALFTPFAGVAVAVLIRVLVGFLGVIGAYPFSRTDFATEIAYRNRLRQWQDRYQQTVAFADLRWTWAVREVAIERLGDTGRVLSWCDPILRWLNYLTLALLTVVAVSRFT
jgi:hypothetical protein